jgi:hypothetical protein
MHRARRLVSLAVLTAAMAVFAAGCHKKVPAAAPPPPPPPPPPPATPTAHAATRAAKR